MRTDELDSRHRLAGRRVSRPADRTGEGLAASHQRSDGLLRFACTYHQVSRVSAAAFEPVAVWMLPEDVLALLESIFA